MRLPLKGKSEKDVLPEAERGARELSWARKEHWVVFYVRPRETRDEHTQRAGTTHFAWIGPEARKKAFLVRVKHEADVRRKAEAEARKAQEEAAKKAATASGSSSALAAPKSNPLGTTPQKKGAAARENADAEKGAGEESDADGAKDEEEPVKDKEKEKPSGSDSKKKGSTGRKA